MLENDVFWAEEKSRNKVLDTLFSFLVTLTTIPGAVEKKSSREGYVRSLQPYSQGAVCARLSSAVGGPKWAYMGLFSMLPAIVSYAVEEQY